ncbi:MAG: sigma-70 family RNA polymerase sigma factor [Acidobacteriota bacterium]|nr:sigma-70 family RNA polymerase sigma factor [Acidobacteriota bacterium]
MRDGHRGPEHSDSRRGGFATTHWSVVVAAGDRASPDAERALASLCEAYWYPLYAFARRRGADPEEARDLTQSFFATLLEKNYVADADRERGRFRTFLLTAFQHHAAKDRARERAAKRGGAERPLSLDYDVGEQRYLLEPVETATPERIYERRWALTILERVLSAVRRDYAETGRSALFDALSPVLVGASPAPSYRAIGEDLGLSEGAVKVAAHRLRRRYRARLRAEIEETVSTPSEVDDELRHLLQAVSG